MKQLLLYLSLFCSCAVIAQEQKYILLDSLTAHYQVKQYTLDTSPYGVKNTIEVYEKINYNYYSLAMSVGFFTKIFSFRGFRKELSSKTLYITSSFFL